MVIRLGLLPKVKLGLIPKVNNVFLLSLFVVFFKHYIINTDIKTFLSLLLAFNLLLLLTI